MNLNLVKFRDCIVSNSLISKTQTDWFWFHFEKKRVKESRPHFWATFIHLYTERWHYSKFTHAECLLIEWMSDAETRSLRLRLITSYCVDALACKMIPKVGGMQRSLWLLKTSQFSFKDWTNMYFKRILKFCLKKLRMHF